MSVTVGNFIKNLFPKEAQIAVGGIALAATSGVAVQSLQLFARHLPNTIAVCKFAAFGLSASLIAGGIISIYSAVRLSQKEVSDAASTEKAIAATALGCLLSAIALTTAECFWKKAPTFVDAQSMTYCVATNLAWQVSAFTTVAAAAFTAYAAYQVGKAALSTDAKGGDS